MSEVCKIQSAVLRQKLPVGSNHAAAVDGKHTLQAAASCCPVRVALHGAALPAAPSLSQLNPKILRRMS